MTKTCGVWTVLGWVAAVVVLPACGDRGEWTLVDDGGVTSPAVTGPGGVPSSSFPNLFQGKTSRAAAKAAAISAGTLLVTRSGTAVASDADRDVVHLVDLGSATVKTVGLADGDEPGRVVEGDAGTVYVAARRGGVVAQIDVSRATVRRIPVCAAPRGLAYDATESKLWVACRSGLLAAVDAKSGKVTRRYQLDEDLRDVVMSGRELVVSRFKSAELMVVGRDGQVLRRARPGGTAARSAQPSVAYRTLPMPSGGVLVGHIEASDATLPSGAGAYYGAPCGGSVADLTLSAVDTAPDEVNPAPSQSTLRTQASHTLGGVAGPIDFAFSGDGARTAFVSVGNSWSVAGEPLPNLFVTTSANLAMPSGVSIPCGGSFTSGGGSTPAASNVPGELVAVAFDRSNSWVVQSRQPAQLQLENGTIISLAADDRFDTGLAMFHMNTGGGVSCTSCHPEAGEDGHTWSFTVGPRRSQALEGGASARAPFHWEGDLGTFESLFEEVMMKRMSLLANVTGKQRSALKDWIDGVPYSASADDLDADAVKRGKTLFERADLACTTCHGGPSFTDNQPHDVGTGRAFISPSLLGVGLRAPLFHDGCAATLEGRFGPCGGGDRHGVTSGLSKAEEADLVAYMRSL